MKNQLILNKHLDGVEASHSNEAMLNAMEEYANERVNSALQEAAKIQDHLRCEHFDNPDEDEIVYNAILSLQIKDTKETTIDDVFKEDEVECEHNFSHAHTNWYRCTKCGFVEARI